MVYVQYLYCVHHLDRTSILRRKGAKYKYSIEKDILVLDMAVFKFIPIIKKLIDVLEGKTPEQVRNISSYILIIFLAGWASLLSGDVAHIWFNGNSMGMEGLHFSYLMGISFVIFIMYAMKIVLPMSMRIAAVKALGEDAEFLLKPSEFQELCDCNDDPDCCGDALEILEKDEELLENVGNSDEIPEVLVELGEKEEVLAEDVSSSP